jgi:hypothetical protein
LAADVLGLVTEVLRIRIARRRRIGGSGSGYLADMPENEQEQPSEDPPEPKEVEADEIERLGQRADEGAKEAEGSGPTTSAPYAPLLRP